MTIYFLDSSALVKRYISETGSGRVRELTSSEGGNIIVVSRTTWVEVSSALARLYREGAIRLSDLEDTMRLFSQDWNIQYRVVEFDAEVARLATDCLFRYSLRAFDAIQLAACLYLKKEIPDKTDIMLEFLSADVRLLSAAEGEKLSVANPNDFHHDYSG